MFRLDLFLQLQKFVSENFVFLKKRTIFARKKIKLKKQSKVKLPLK